MKKFYTTLFLILATVFSFTQPVLADDSPGAKHKADDIPTWVICIGAWIAFIVIVFIMPTTVTGPALEWLKKRRGKNKPPQDTSNHYE